jgi:hypothetical protein
MINVISKRCIYEGCTKHPSFGMKDTNKKLYCKDHKTNDMIHIGKKKCIVQGCILNAYYNYKNNRKTLYCNKHKLDNMIYISNPICINHDCIKTAYYNSPDEKKPLYCEEHKDKDKSKNMINVKNKKCQHKGCSLDANYGLINKKSQYCNEHKKDNMINLIQETKCSIENCNNDYIDIVSDIKYCLIHTPNKNLEIIIKKLCKYCEIKENSEYICSDCNNIRNKKEWSIIRYLRKNINKRFEYNSSNMLQGCSIKRPDVYFDLLKHSIIVEIDEHQHNSYKDTCECARLNEIVNGIGGKSVIIIRYNPDVVKNNSKVLKINQTERLELLVKTIKEELDKNYDEFQIKLIQLFYDDNYEKYQNYKEENITNIVCI